MSVLQSRPGPNASWHLQPTVEGKSTASATHEPFTCTDSMVYGGFLEICGLHTKTLVTNVIRTGTQYTFSPWFLSKQICYCNSLGSTQIPWGALWCSCVFFAQSEFIQTIIKFMRLPLTIVGKRESNVFKKKERKRKSTLPQASWTMHLGY